MYTRRKLHARREAAEGLQAETASSSSNSAAGGGFVWATDRSPSSPAAAPPAAASTVHQPGYDHPQAFAGPSVHAHQSAPAVAGGRGGSNRPPQQQQTSSRVQQHQQQQQHSSSAAAQNGFAWISDFLDDTPAAPQQQQLQGKRLSTTTRLSMLDATAVLSVRALSITAKTL